jgi:hypothetical protein
VLLSAEQDPSGGLDVILPHQALADEEASHAGRGKSKAIGMDLYAALADQ